MSPYIYWLEENKDLSFKCFMTSLFKGNHLPKPQIPIGIYHAGSGTGFFMWTSFPNSFSIICTQGANTVWVSQRQAFGTDDTGTGLIYQSQHLSTLFNCCIFTNKWQTKHVDSCSFWKMWEKAPYPSYKSFRFWLSENKQLILQKNWSCKKIFALQIALTINWSQELVLT